MFYIVLGTCPNCYLQTWYYVDLKTKGLNKSALIAHHQKNLISLFATFYQQAMNPTQTFDEHYSLFQKSLCQKPKQWLLVRKFSEYKFSKCEVNFWPVLEFAKMHDSPNFCDSRRQIWQVLIKFWQIWQIWRVW